MSEWISAILLILGALFMFIGALGIVRLPDYYMRSHAAAKATSFGALLMLAAVALHFATTWVIIEALLIVIFIFLTAPVASHILGRAAYFLKTPMWKGTIMDELQGRYDFRKHTLESKAVGDGESGNR